MQTQQLLQPDGEPAAVFYTLQPTSEVGIGNSIYFSTEQHPKKKENRIGMLTMQMHEHTESPVGGGDTPPPVKTLIKCSKIEPVLTGIVSGHAQAVMDAKEPLHRHINAHLCKYYANCNGYHQEQQQQRDDAKMPPLSDSLYVLGVTLCAAAGSASAAHDAGIFGSTSSQPLTLSGGSPAGPAEAGKKRKLESGGSSADKKRRVCPSPPGPAMGGATTLLQIKFCRVEDVPIIMQACRVFFKSSVFSKGGTQVVFPRGEMPGWWNMLHNAPFDFKKTRDSFHNQEVVEQVVTRSGIHYYTRFSLDPSDASFKTRQRTLDGCAWISVIYIDFSKLRLLGPI